MPLFELKSVTPACVLEDAAADYRTARKLGQYRVSQKAVYFAGFPGTHYVPYTAVTRALTRNTSLPLTGCCGKALAMVRYRVYYGEDAYQDFLFEKLSQANEALDALVATRPELPIERETQLASAI